jgi:tellurite resistance protein TerC
VLIDVYKIPVAWSLGVVVAILAITMIWSVKTAPKIDDANGASDRG